MRVGYKPRTGENVIETDDILYFPDRGSGNVSYLVIIPKEAIEGLYKQRETLIKTLETMNVDPSYISNISLEEAYTKFKNWFFRHMGLFKERSEMLTFGDGVKKNIKNYFFDGCIREDVFITKMLRIGTLAVFFYGERGISAIENAIEWWWNDDKRMFEILYGSPDDGELELSTHERKLLNGIRTPEMFAKLIDRAVNMSVTYINRIRPLVLPGLLSHTREMKGLLSRTREMKKVVYPLPDSVYYAYGYLDRMRARRLLSKPPRKEQQTDKEKKVVGK